MEFLVGLSVACERGLDEVPSQNELLNITLNSSNGKLFLKAENNGALSTVAILGNQGLLTNVAVRAVFDLDADTYDIYVNNNGAGENLVANELLTVSTNDSFHSKHVSLTCFPLLCSMK